VDQPTYWFWTRLSKIAVAIQLYGTIALLVAKWLGWMQLSYTAIFLFFLVTFILSHIVSSKRARFIMDHQKDLTNE
jgi:uncharacterized membrane protein YcgQ (UPF0703/DUF1980 family)